MITNRVPWPLKDGGALCAYQSLQGFQRAGVSVGLVSFNTTKHRVALPIKDSVFEDLDYFETVDLDNRVSFWGGLRSLFSSQSYVMSRFNTEAFIDAIDTAIRVFEPTTVQFEVLYSAVGIQQLKERHPTIHFNIRMHNVEQHIWHRLATQTSNPIKKWYFYLLQKRLASEENLILAQADLLLCITSIDQRWANSTIAAPSLLFPYCVSPDLADHGLSLEKKLDFPLSFYHLGSMDWLPNKEAMSWWLHKIWPLFDLKLSYPFHLAGRFLDSPLWENFPLDGVIIDGEIEDVTLYLQDKRVLVVPLKTGGGMRIKILEAMQNHILVIATSVALEGIDGVTGVHFLEANNPQEFVDAMHLVVSHPEQITPILANAKQLILEHYDLDFHIEQIISLSS